LYGFHNGANVYVVGSFTGNLHTRIPKIKTQKAKVPDITMEKWHQEQRSVKVGDQLKKKDAANFLHGYREKNISTASSKASVAQKKSAPLVSSPQTSIPPAASTEFQVTAATTRTKPEQIIINTMAGGMGGMDTRKTSKVSNTMIFCCTIVHLV
jgi:hypothetical protein